MPDLIFGTRGQAETLAAQEAIAAKARAIRAEFQGGKGALEQWKDPLGRISDQVYKGFDPARIGKWVSTFVGTGAAINQLRMELDDIQAQIDNVAERQKKGYEEAVKAGDTERADRLKKRVDSISAFESGAQAMAEAQSTEFLGGLELKAFDEMMAGSGQGYTERTVRSLGRRASGGGGVRRDDAIAALKDQQQWFAGVMQKWAMIIERRQEDGRTLTPDQQRDYEQQGKQLDALNKMLTQLESLNSKDGAPPGSPE